MPRDTSIRIEYWVYGETTDKVNIIHVDKKLSIAEVQNSIKQDIPDRLSDVEAHGLHLYLVSPEHKTNLMGWSFHGKSWLNAEQKVSALDLSHNFIVVHPLVSALPMSDITINYWIRAYSGTQADIGSIRVSSSMQVSSLKATLIASNTGLRGYFPDDLRLYEVDVPLSRGVRLVDSFTACGLKSISTLGSQLIGGLKLCDAFCTLPSQEPKLHVVVDTPMPIRCWPRGSHVSKSFMIRVPLHSVIDDFKANVAQQENMGFPEAVYKLDYDPDDSDKLIEDLKTHGAGKLLLGHELVCDVFGDIPFFQTPKIALEFPGQFDVPMAPMSPAPNLTVAALRASFLANRKAIAPSTGRIPTEFFQSQKLSSLLIPNGRPGTSDSFAPIPITLLHPVFGSFLDDCDTDAEAAPEDERFAYGLSMQMIKGFDKEADRVQSFCDVCSDHGFKLLYSKTRNGYPMDAAMFVNDFHYLITEFKNEVGSKAAEPYFQVMLYFLEATRSYAERYSTSSLPCMFLIGVGPTLYFAGGAWDRKPVMQMLSSVVASHHHTHTHLQQIMARHLGALRRATRNLREYYQNLSPVNNPQNQLFPYYRSFTSISTGNQQAFNYIEQLFAEKLVFIGELVEPDSNGTKETTNQGRICVKFTQRYSKEAHEIFHSLGCAPKLCGYENIPGGWLVVVMDALESDSYQRLCDMPVDTRITPELSENIQEKIMALHERGYVHGDVRDANIMVSLANPAEFMLLDFDWAGKAGKVRYPVDINTTTMWRPRDVESRGVIEIKHDIQMMKSLLQEDIHSEPD